MIAALLAKIISWRPTGGGQKQVAVPPHLSDNLHKEEKDEMVPLLMSDTLHKDKEDNNSDRVRKGSVVSVCEVFAHERCGEVFTHQKDENLEKSNLTRGFNQDSAERER